ncbi:MAG TPA: DUF5668 domain-containing protein [Thermoanaerobaculia bacterium]
MPTTVSDEQTFSAGKLVIGIALLAIGLASFLDSSDLWHPRNLIRYWPLALVLIGIANEIDAIRRRRSDGSFILAAVGVWMLGTVDAFDLSMRSTFPLAISVVGLALLIHAIVDLPETGREGDEK